MFWKAIAWIVSRPFITERLIAHAMKTPYFNLPGYMNRWWLFNRYSEVGSMKRVPKKYPRLPSIRIHHILRADTARDPHSHPWSARTVILKGWYTEERLRADGEYDYFLRKKGDTATLSSDTFHNITQVSEGGVWTLFITGKYEKGWGFQTKDGFIPHREYIES